MYMRAKKLVPEAKFRANDGTYRVRRQMGQIKFVLGSLVLAVRFVLLVKWGQRRLSTPKSKHAYK